VQAVVVSCLQERAPLGWLKRWKLAGPLKNVTRTVNCDHLSQAFRSFMALNQTPSHGAPDVAGHPAGQRCPVLSKKASRSAKKQSSGGSAAPTQHATGFGSSGHGDGIRRSAEELLAKAGDFRMRRMQSV
jgi:hypothetical protein